MRSFGTLAALGFLIAGACSSPTQVVLPPVEALVASGDGQYGTTGQTLVAPLHVVVRSIDTELPRRGVTVVWTVEEGDASIVGIAATVTDSTGSARVTVRLGQSIGPVTVRATVQQQERAFAEFRAFVVARPVLEQIEPLSAAPGTSIVLTGQNFSPDSDQNIVLFSGIRGRVTEASGTELTVIVPLCLPERSVALTVQLGAVASASRTFQVEAGGSVLGLAVGEFVDATDDAGFTCVTVPGDGTARYLALVQSTGRVGAAAHPFSFRGLSASGPPPAAVEGPLSAPTRRLGTIDSRVLPISDGHLAVELSDPQRRLDERLREIERELTRGRHGQVSGPSRVDMPSAVPALNERRTFQVFQGPGQFQEITAVARHIGARAALFVDENAPSGGYTPQDLAAFSDRFDDYIHPTVTSTFGSESDLDANDRVIVLLSPAVNSLTPRGSAGFVGGFFFGVDLLPESEGSNQGEVFYTLVPDPSGIYSDPRPKEAILELAPAILAHEFQHMVNFNERVLVRGAEANEAVWLSEGLAQYAEELVARAYEVESNAESAEIFRDGTRDRAARYLAGPDTVSLIVSVGSGSLSERGAGYLFILYLADQAGDEIVGRLTRTTRTGVTNVEAETGTEWAVSLSDWWSAIALDGPDPESGPTVYPTVDLKGFIGSPYPLAIEDVGAGDFQRSGSLPSASVAYFEIVPAPGGSTTLRLGGAAGGVSRPQAGLRMRIVRVQ
ncbi:MAG: IPT/TIG domain-containing protein [Gemmatimonadota bacterium]|nr:IPT/TIG domain-containing protein [Gemmatimonadota bacterium]